MHDPAQRDVPFVVFSATSQSRNSIREFINAAWVEKPASGDVVLQALANHQFGRVRREA
jgi:hypothetical protein